MTTIEVLNQLSRASGPVTDKLLSELWERGLIEQNAVLYTNRQALREEVYKLMVRFIEKMEAPQNGR